MADKIMEIVTPKTISRVMDECESSGLYALDLETNGLDNRVYAGRTRKNIVGACISPDGVRGYYIPVLHPNFMEHCVPFTLFANELRRLVASPAVAIFHNGKFDQEFLQFNGGEPIGEWDDHKKWEDTLILTYLRDTRARDKRLKHLAKQELDMEMFELDELFTLEEEERGEKYNFGVLDPTWEPALWYGASDAICTYLLYKHLKGAALDRTEAGLPSQQFIYNVEKLCVAATRWMERCRIPIDRPKVEELVRVGQREWLPALTEVYTEAGKALGRDISPGYFKLMSEKGGKFQFDPEDVEHGITITVERSRAEAERQHLDETEPDGKGKLRVKTIQKNMPHLVEKKKTEAVAFPIVYDVLIPDQLGLLLRELGVQGLKVTEKSGQIQTSRGELDRVIEEAGDEYPYIPKVKRFREVTKAIASNLLPILEATVPGEICPDGRIRINFEGFKTDTARFSTPQKKEVKEWTGTANWNLHSIPNTHDTKRPLCSTRIREAIKVKSGRKLYAVDFSGEELRVVTHLSMEPLWVKEFFRCSKCGTEFEQGGDIPVAPPPYCPKCGSDKIGDLHTLTAQSIFGQDVMSTPEGKHKRDMSKGVNFALCYGGGGNAVVRAAHVPIEEGRRIKSRFDATYKGLAGWWKKQYEYARKHKLVLTAFNRRYPLPDIDSADGGFRSKAERNAVNGPIQGSGSDIMKIAMGLIYRMCKERGWLDSVMMIITIHDELVFEIEDHLAAEAIPLIKEIMLRRTVEKIKWRIPLTCDIECGEDWTVPWNITEIQHGKAPVPPELEGMFGPATAPAVASTSDTPIVATSDTLPAIVPVKREAPVVMPSAPALESLSNGHVVAPTPLQTPYVAPVAPALPRGAEFIHVVKTHDLTMLMISRIAKVILMCKGSGTHPCRITSESGETLWDGGNVLINPAEFAAYLRIA